MISVAVTTRDGRLWRIVAEGHAPRGERGASAPCAAVSALLKGAGLALLDSPDFSVTGSLEAEGRYDLTVTRCDDAVRLQGLMDVLRNTLQEIAREWPRDVTVTMYKE